MYRIPIKEPSPDFEGFKRILMGEEKPQKVPFVELWVDEEIRKFITENLMGRKYVFPPPEFSLFAAVTHPSCMSSGEKQAYWRQNINFFYRMGFDYLPDSSAGLLFHSIIEIGKRVSDDTAELSKGKRVWAEEGKGIIRSWEDIEKVPWKRMERIGFDLHEYYDFLSKNLPEGMKITTQFSLYEMALEWLFGYEGLFFLLYDQPGLVKAVYDRLGKIVYDFYESVIDLEDVGVIWHADDMGYKTSTMLNPEALRELIFPWLKKYALLAHKHGKQFWLHSCGNVLEVMEDLIEDVKIDAFHSFQDVIIPVGEFKQRYGNRVATLGGVDVDKLCRLDEENLRRYIRGILQECMPGGRYAFGSGNSVTNYVPIRSYLIMLQEAMNWKSSA